MREYKPIHFTRLLGTRIIAQPNALGIFKHDEKAITLRFAPDELFITAAPNAVQTDALLANDPHAIIVAEGAFSAAWVEEGHALTLLEQLAEWEMPSERPAFVQGAVAGLATKLWFEQGRVLFVVQTPYAHELEERLA